MSNFLDPLIAFITRSAPQDVQSITAQRGLRSIADSLAVMLAGAHGELATPLLGYADGHPGNIPVVGLDRRTDPETAALLNGSFGHAFDFDDGFPGYPVHPSNVVTAALISGMSDEAASGADFLAAFVAGVEVMIAVGRRMGIGHYERGFHATATLGAFGGIAGLAVLQKLPAIQVRNALGIGASMASGIQRNFGTMTKPFHAGLAARNAVTAVNLAKLGMTAHEDAFDGPDGFIAAFSRPGDSTAQSELPTFDALARTGLGLKKFPCVNAAHRPIDGVLTLRARHGLTPDNVRRILCLVPPGSTRPLKYADPKTAHECKFSLQYLLAAALVDGRVSLGSFTDSAIARPNVRALFERIEVREDPNCAGNADAKSTRGPGTRGFVEVQIENLDVGTIREHVEFAPGNPAREMTMADISDKFLGCAAYAGIEERRAARIATRLASFAAAEDVRAIVADIRP